MAQIAALTICISYRCDTRRCSRVCRWWACHSCSMDESTSVRLTMMMALTASRMLSGCCRELESVNSLRMRRPRSCAYLCLVRRLRPVGNQLTNDLMAAQTTEQNIEPTSGPDQDGPIWGYHFVPNQPAQSITSEAAVEFLSAPGPGAAE